MTAIPFSKRDDAKTRLILAAEILFAKGGIDGVSLREIASGAGQRNHHAVQYHFGNRETLVQAIFDFRMDQMEAMRGKMLEEARREGMLQDARTIVDIIFLPQLDLIDAHGDNSYANFLCQYLLRNADTEFGRFGGHLPRHIAEALALLRARLDFLDDKAAQRRLITACFMFLNILATHTRYAADHRVDQAFAAALDDTLEQIVAATCMPFVRSIADQEPKKVSRA
ncbi:MAG TPA: helix-turn-helix domain-containing protein [Sphingorhabdus lacus]|nr:helix-turn-helix domain-containing protein [Sphingorhabdus lacus]